MRKRTLFQLDSGDRTILYRSMEIVRDYEIRIVSNDRCTSMVFVTSQASDADAIRRARALTPEGEGAEVWRGMTCIHADHDARLSA